MKGYTAVITACLMVTGAFSGCSRKTSSESPKLDVPAVTTAQEATQQPDPLAAATSATTAVTTVTSAAAVTSAAVTATVQPVTAEPDPLGGGAFSYDDNGAVVFDTPVDTQNDAVLIAAAQKLFDSACKTYWNYLVDCPYDMDYSSYVENDFGWQFYKVTTAGINSFADVEKDYGKVFSSRYPNDLSTNYREQNGAVYALNGSRGAHLYYSASKITDVQSKTDDEIFFTVENFYDGSDFGDESYSETDVFSVVIEGDTWKVGRFTLPY